MSITYVLTHPPRNALLLALAGPLLAAVLMGCGQIQASVQAAQATPTVAPPPPTATATSTPTPTPYASSVRTVPLGRPTGTPPMGHPLPDHRVAEILALLLL